MKTKYQYLVLVKHEGYVANPELNEGYGYTSYPHIAEKFSTKKLALAFISMTYTTQEVSIERRLA